MHGFILLEFEKFIIKNHGYKQWQQIAQKAGAEGISIDAMRTYSDSVVFDLVGATVESTGTELELLLEQFGYALVPNLLTVYKAYIDPTWKTLDVLEHTENTLHHAVRSHNSDVTPPILQIERQSANRIQIIYQSARNIPQLGVGVVKGIAEHYGETDKLHVHLSLKSEGVYIIDVQVY